MNNVKTIFSQFLFALVLFTIASVVVSCQSKEEKVIAELEKICETVESDDFSVEDLQSIQNQYEKLVSQLGDCDFSPEQVEQVGKIQGRITVAFGKMAVLKSGDVLDSVLNAGKGFLEGVEEELEKQEE